MLTNHSSRRFAGYTIALAALAMVLIVPSAGAATFSSGKVKLSFGQRFASALKSSKTKVKGTGGTVVKGRAATFNIKQGTGTLASPFSDTLGLSGTLDFKRGKRTVRLKNLAQVLAGNSGRFKSRKSTILTEATKGKASATPGFTGLKLSSARLKLTKSGAKTLNRKLRTKKFKANMTAGTVRANAERSVVLKSGNTRVAIDSGTYAKFQSCMIDMTPLAPATEPSPPPSPKFNLPISGGLLTAKSTEGVVTNSGGIRLNEGPGGPRPHQSDLTGFEITLNPSGSSFSANASDLGGARVPIGPLDRTGQTVQTQYTATGGSVTITGGTLRLSAQAASLLAANFGCNAIAANDPLGTIEEISAQVQ